MQGLRMAGTASVDENENITIKLNVQYLMKLAYKKN